jgi:hypothetical protein
MDRKQQIDRLERHGAVYRALLDGLSPEEVRWRTAPDKWCTQEILCHLCDEELEDFHARLEHVLTSPEAPLPPSTPLEWMATRNYMDRDYHTELECFLAEREKTVAWLRNLENAPWHNVHQHPKVGPIPAELFLVNWVAHDLHHFRQLNNLRYRYLEAHTALPLDYAGVW